ncbi:hypothetical protein JTE90_026270 [Oedothorax gibbosus]|uniref:Uncharacterized protein n=1 Tax=Oedothorax gibbosus TaxID=931172 RepID=A0AAV6U3X7_9ARAC|nr:hypothetical protein JTE90_026270 [Oedothorax gibbosus]
MGSVNSCFRRIFPCLGRSDNGIDFNGQSDTVRLQRKSTISMNEFPTFEGTFEDYATNDVPTVMEGHVATDQTQRLSSSRSFESPLHQRPLQQNRPSTQRPSEVKLTQQQIEPNKLTRDIWNKLHLLKKTETSPSKSLSKSSAQPFFVENQNVILPGTLVASNTESQNRQVDPWINSPSRVVWKRCFELRRRIHHIEWMPNSSHSPIFGQNEDSNGSDSFAESTEPPIPQEGDRNSDLMPLRPSQLQILQVRNNPSVDFEESKEQTLECIEKAS